MNNRPFFSIVIATYNRIPDLKFALERILKQTFEDFEVIISDDSSTDETESVVKSFEDKRIKYFKNSKNLGAVENIGKVLSYPKGKYVFMHGDDDYLLYDNVLSNAYRNIKEGNYGLVRLNYLYQTFNKENVFDYMRNKTNLPSSYIKSNKSPREILEFIKNIDLFFISGIIFKNPLPKKIKIIKSELMPWFNVCFESINSNGGFYDSDCKIIASWSSQKKHPGYYVENGKLSFENFYEEIRKITNDDNYRSYLAPQLEASVSLLPAIKYNSNNINLIKYANRIIQLDPEYKSSLKFWILLIISFLTPKFILRIIRLIFIKKITNSSEIKNHEYVIKRVHELRNIKK